MNLTTRVQLAAMMFLQFFVWGAWYVTMSTYMTETLKATGLQVGAAYSANAIATIISPFIVGLIADRYFAAQKFMGVLHLVGAALLYYATTVSDPNAFFWVILFYSMAYMPTLALANSVAFNLMSEPDKEFPRIRVFGTLGWIIVGLIIGSLHFNGIMNLATTNFPFKIAAGASLLLGIMLLHYRIRRQKPPILREHPLGKFWGLMRLFCLKTVLISCFSLPLFWSAFLCHFIIVSQTLFLQRLVWRMPQAK